MMMLLKKEGLKIVEVGGPWALNVEILNVTILNVMILNVKILNVKC